MTRTIMLDDALEREAAQILSGIGMTVDEAISRMLVQVVHDHCLPFAMHLPNDETVAAMDELESGAGVEYTSLDALFRDMRA
jgi:DNA-damage-inducible protein J